MPTLRVLLVDDPVILSGEVDKTGRHSLALESIEDLNTLRSGTTEIFSTVHDELWSLEVFIALAVFSGRVFEEGVSGSPWGTTMRHFEGIEFISFVVL